MKRILAIVMSLVVVFGICIVGTGCDPNKETEAEYKARIKKELDEIPIEATGYKLVDPTKQEVTYPEGEKPRYKDGPDVLETNNHKYLFGYGVLSGDLFGITSTIDDGERRYVKFQNAAIFESYQDQFRLFLYDEKIFIVRYRDFNPSSYTIYYTCFCPPILFLYDAEENSAKYVGYLSDWFDYKIKKLRKTGITRYIFTIVKL